MRHAIYATVSDERQVREEIAWQAQAGVDFIKVYQDLPPALVHAAIDEAHRRGIRVIGHLQATTWTAAARMGIDFIAHAAPWAAEYLPEAAGISRRCSAASTGWNTWIWSPPRCRK
jgi:hypothetical protein